ncbi:MAG: peptide chain release factor N(5)-glutamine methyltransferase [Lentisphaerae bacterium]|jgi:release factor glutamine methyltransferase|nr:peptide chain release factor N(5)-glutamine methyltransferase [Lentisphaerota bacterium]
MNWRETIARTDAFLSAKGVEDSRVCAELLAARLLKCGRGGIAAHASDEVREAHLEAMRRAIRRLSANEPLQYVLGEWDFRTLTLKCDRRALIPRPETEELVTRVLAHLRSHCGAMCPFIVDVGTGTGAIILSLAAEYRGEAVFLATDVSEDALSLAKENAEKCGLADKVRFAAMDGLDDFDEPEIVDVIVSNPPYIESAVCDTLAPNVRDWEPRLALDGGAEGLDFYDRYLADALNILKPGGAVFFEIGEGQGEALRKLMTGYGFEGIRIEKDYAGHDRYACATLP